MKASVKAAWIAALRSGKYKQGRDVMRSLDNTFCCLGVLADMCKVFWLRKSNVVTPRYEFFYEEKSNDFYFLPAFLQHIGLTDDEQQKLSIMNDNSREGNNFAAIADYIEENIIAVPD